VSNYPWKSSFSGANPPKSIDGIILWSCFTVVILLVFSAMGGFQFIFGSYDLLYDDNITSGIVSNYDWDNFCFNRTELADEF